MADDLLRTCFVGELDQVVARDALRGADAIRESGVIRPGLDRSKGWLMSCPTLLPPQVIGALMEADMATDECNTDTEANRRRVRDQALSRAKRLPRISPILRCEGLDGAG